MKNMTCVFAIVAMFALATSCKTTMIEPMPAETAGVGEDVMISDMRGSCISRINEVAQEHNKLRRRAKIWSVTLGLVGGVGTAVGTVSTLEPLDQYVGPPVSAVSAIIGALSTILSPFAPSADDATMLASKHGALLSTLYQADMMRAPEQRSVRMELLQRCSNAP